MSAKHIQVLSPGRTNLIGEHIDYLGGNVLPAAIDLAITLDATCTSESSTGKIISRLGDPEITGEIDLNDLSRRDDPDLLWQNYIIGVLFGYQQLGYEIPGFECTLTTTLPIGAGLSASAALETAFGVMVEAYNDKPLSAAERASLCQKAEHDYAGVPCGIMDQLAVSAGQDGHAILIDCDTLETQAISIPEGMSIVLARTGVSHSLADGEYAKRRADCEAALEILGQPEWVQVDMDQVEAKKDELGDRLYRRSRHAVTEIARVGQFVTSLQNGDREALSRLMHEGHASLRDDYEVSCPELDVLVEAGYDFGAENGHVASRMTGGGFGGSTVNLVEDHAAQALIDHLTAAYVEKFGNKPDCYHVQASDGARTI